MMRPISKEDGAQTTLHCLLSEDARILIIMECTMHKRGSNTVTESEGDGHIALQTPFLTMNHHRTDYGK